MYEKKTYCSNAQETFLQTQHHLSTHRPNQFLLTNESLLISLFIHLGSLQSSSCKILGCFFQSTHLYWSQPPTFSIPVPKQMSKAGEISLNWNRLLSLYIYNHPPQVRPWPWPLILLFFSSISFSILYLFQFLRTSYPHSQVMTRLQLHWANKRN